MFQKVNSEFRRLFRVVFIYLFFINMCSAEEAGKEVLPKADIPLKKQVFKTVSSPRPEAVFRDKLSKALVISKDYYDLLAPSPEQAEQFKKSVDELKNFSDEFSGSELADDAFFTYICLSFIDAITAQEQTEAQALLDSMQGMVDQNPGGKLENLTIQESRKEVCHYITDVFLQIPYKYILLYMKGVMGWEFKDYELVVNNYVELKDNLDYSKDEHGYLAADIYTAMVESYRRLGRFKEAYNLAKEAVDRFPDNRGLSRAMKKIVQEGGSYEN